MVRKEAGDYPEHRECKDKQSIIIASKFEDIYSEDLKKKEMKSIRTDNR